MSELLDAAREALERAYAPYSKYEVGAAVRTADGAVFTGCNIEVANYTNTQHAEEVAVAAAVASGHREFEAIAVTTAADDGATPCGMCRQTLAEFDDGSLRVLVDDPDGPTEYTLAELLPHAFTGDMVRSVE